MESENPATCGIQVSGVRFAGFRARSLGGTSVFPPDPAMRFVHLTRQSVVDRIRKNGIQRAPSAYMATPVVHAVPLMMVPWGCDSDVPPIPACPLPWDPYARLFGPSNPRSLTGLWKTSGGRTVAVVFDLPARFWPVWCDLAPPEDVLRSMPDGWMVPRVWEDSTRTLARQPGDRHPGPDRWGIGPWKVANPQAMGLLLRESLRRGWCAYRQCESMQVMIPHHIPASAIRRIVQLSYGNSAVREKRRRLDERDARAEWE